MRAILDNDIIVNFSERGTVDLPTLPRRVGLDRLRWDGTKLVDLGKLDQIWVEYRNGVFILHAIKVADSQLVAMRYRDRKKLTLTLAGIIRLKTIEEETTHQRRQTVTRIKALRDLRMKSNIGVQVDIVMFLLKLIYLITKALRTGNTQLLAILDNYLNKMHLIYGDDAETVADVVAVFDKIKEILIEYEQKIGDIP